MWGVAQDTKSVLQIVEISYIALCKAKKEFQEKFNSF